jgi:nucleoside phosphorylase
MTDSKTRRPCAIIVTAIPVEYQAVRSHLSQLHEETHPQGAIYECGIFQSEKQAWDVGIVEIGAGNVRTALEAERAIAYFQPELMFFVGVAGGLKDVALGDVVVATKVYGYEFGKADRTFRSRPEVGESSFRLEHRARAEGRKSDWLKRLGSLVSDPAPKVFVAPIAAGEKVVSSKRSATWKFLTTTYGDALAVEMEGHGFLQVAHANQQVLALIIRGISDLIDDKTEADVANIQELAARHASAFAFEVLAKLDPKPGQEKTFEDFTRSQRDIKDYKDKVDGKWKEEKDDDGDTISQHKQFRDSAKYISKTLKNERKIVTFFPESESKVETTDLPKTEEAFTRWYYKLGDYEQYYVLTTAVLHGAPVREVVKHTESLYQFIHDEVERRGNLIRVNSRNGDQLESQHKESVRFSDPLLRTISGKELRRITFTETRMKKGVECLYWQDADQFGLSTFGLNLLEFLCKEYIGKGELGQFFLNALQHWSEENTGEVTRKANHSEVSIGEVTRKGSQSKESIDNVIRKAIETEESIDEVNRRVIHSYGVVLWSHDAKTLGRKAKSWALENKPVSTAELLDGAYEIYKVKSDERASNVETPSVVLPLLRNWIKHIHKVLSTDEFEFEESKAKLDSREASSKETGKKEGEKQVDTKEAGSILNCV